MTTHLPPEEVSFLSEAELEALLISHPNFNTFWESHAPLLIVRTPPSMRDPLCEIQLVWDLGSRLETYCWLWIDARNGEIVRQFPE